MSAMRLSFCISTRNRGALLGETLASIISQATEDVEIVIVDGASTDNTSDVVRSIQASFPRLRYVRQTENTGIDQGFAEAVHLARGEYCWLFSDDDLLKPDAIKTVLDAIKENDGLVIVNTEVLNATLEKVLEPQRLSLRANRRYRANQMQALFIDVANHLSFIGCVIVKTELWNSRDKKDYLGSYFVHVGIIFQSTLPQDTLVIAKPLVSVRYGNASWLEKYFEIWMFKWPELIWSFAAFSESAKRQVCPKEPWRKLKTLLLHRAKGTYTLNAYHRWLAPRLMSYWSRATSRLIAISPGRVANLLAMIYLSVFRRPDYLLALLDLRNSPFYFARLTNQGDPMAEHRSAPGRFQESAD